MRTDGLKGLKSSRVRPFLAVSHNRVGPYDQVGRIMDLNVVTHLFHGFCCSYNNII